MSNPNKTVGNFASRRASTPEEIKRREESREARRDPAFAWMCDQIKGGRVFESFEQAKEEFEARKVGVGDTA